MIRALTLGEYQTRAQATDHLPQDDSNGADPRLAPLLGLAGEVGTLLAGYKKYLRDNEAYELFDENVTEELGDILWYLANAAEKFGLSLETIAEENLSKTSDRWPDKNRNERPTRSEDDHFDAGLSEEQQLPRTFDVRIRPVDNPDGPEPKVELEWNGQVVADSLGDNTYADTGYRFHDAFHLANAAVLGWSPVARGKIFKHKREKGTKTDAVEDGGRAIVLEEAFAAFVFEYGSQHRELVDVRRLDYHVLKTFRTFTHDLEVQRRPLWEVEEAIFQGFAAWRELKVHAGGILRGNLTLRTLEFIRE
jgi:NTP pyrophosphatase (non-canonical NTP hydrolase)